MSKKKNYILFLLIYLSLNSFIWSQNLIDIQSILDENKFPAISKDGKSILYFYSPYMSGITPPIYLKKFNLTKQESTDEILLFPEYSDEKEKVVINQNIINKKVEKLLKDHDYYTMIKIDTFSIQQHVDTLTNVIFSSIQKKFYSAPFKLTENKLHPYCCDNLNGVPCVIKSHIVNLWVDSNHKFIFIEQGTPQATNGCETGPYYNTFIINSKTYHKQELEIRSLIDKYVEARENKDTVLLESILLSDIDQLVSSGTWRNGKEESMMGMLQSSKNNPGTRKIIVEKIRFISSGSAIVDARYEIQSTNGSVRKMWSTFIVANYEGAWKISAIRNMLPTKQK